ncbi:hypothetical protein BCY86_07930 [Pajaroellobacter abortibovis]|uniref:Uncharacterized protein n=1 Tax=Pajaroellobacter abortibovis TaxID=1882918 RepID=A0A1L6MYV3_9BACT|nr:hypothetical protein BCY86_07930 [Pajaroellobacter abortibovis]
MSQLNYWKMESTDPAFKILFLIYICKNMKNESLLKVNLILVELLVYGSLSFYKAAVDFNWQIC